MARFIQFTKMEGLGNDYIYVNTLKYPLNNPEEKAKIWSAYHTGIGGDGLVLIGASDKADFSMRIFNADGSEALMCGNASRCIGKYLYEYGLTDKTTILLDTLSGIKVLNLHLEGNKVDLVTVDMGMPSGMKTVHPGDEYSFDSTYVSVGNPHLVTFVDDINKVDLPVIGPKLENHPFYPDRINVEFAQVLGEGKIRMRVWERGSGITQACGTGACATAIAAAFNHKTGRKAEIIMDGGRLTIEWEEQTDHILMTGPAAIVFDGTIAVED